MHRVVRKAGRITAWTLSIVLTLALLAALFIQSPWFKRLALKRITTEVNATLTGDVRAEKLTGSMLWSSTLHNVRLRDSRSQPVARIDEVTVEYSIFTLLGGAYHIEALHLERPLLLARYYPDGELNLAHLTRPSAPIDYEVARYTVSEGALLYVDTRNEAALDTAGAGALADLAPGTIAPIAAVDEFLAEHFETGGRRDFSAIQSAFLSDELADEPHSRRIPRVVIADGLGLGGELRGTEAGETLVSVRDARLALDADVLPRPVALSLREADIEMAPERIELTVGDFAADGTSRLAAMHIDATLAAPSQEANGDATGDDTSPDPETAAAEETAQRLPVEQFSARIDQLTVSPELVALIARETRLASAVTLDIEASGTAQKVDARLDASVPEGGSVRIQGSYQPDGPSYQFTSQWSSFALGRWLSTALPKIAFDAQFSLDGRGASLAALQAEADLSVRGLSVGEITVDELDAAASGNDRRIDLTSLRLGSPYFSGSGDGHLAADGDFAVSFEGQTPETGLAPQIAEKLGVAPDQLGDARLKAEAAGQLDMQERRFPEIIRRLRAMLNWNIGAVEMKTTQIDASNGRLVLAVTPSGEISGTRRFSLNGRGRFRGFTVPGYSLESGVVTARADGLVQPRSDVLLAGLYTGSAQGNISFEKLRTDENRIESGDVDVSLGRNSADDALTYSLNGTLVDVQTPQQTAGRIRADLRGEVPPVRNGTPRRIDRFTTRGTLSATSLETPEVAVGGLDARISLSGAPYLPGETMNYEVDGSAAQASYGAFDAATVTFDLAGSLVPTEDTNGTLQALAASGDVGLEILRGYGLRIREVDTQLDFAGSPDLPKGELRSRFDRIGVGDLSFGSASLGVKLREQRRFRLDTEAIPSLVPSLSLFLRSAGTYDTRASRYRVEMLELGRSGLVWKMPEPSEIVVDDGRVTLSSFALQGVGQRVDLDGTYDLRDADTLSELIARLGLNPLGNILDVEGLRRELFDQVLEESKRIEKKARQEAEKAREKVEKEAEEARQKAEQEVEKGKKKLEEQKEKLDKETEKQREKIDKETEKQREKIDKEKKKLEKKLPDFLK